MRFARFETINKGGNSMYQEDVKDTLRGQLEISRERAISLGEEAVRIIRNGHYDLQDYRRVDIQDDLERSIKGTQVYRQHFYFPEKYAGELETIIKVQNQTTLAAVQELIAIGEKPVALNFSSPSEPGGGFLRGSRAQEEYLARSSGIWACLNECPVYFHSKTDLDYFYKPHFIYSPDVVVFRDDDSVLLENPYTTAIISAPSVQANVIRHYQPALSAQINEEMWKRILSVLYIARKHGHTAIVLGAWGCGDFGNNGYEVAEMFKKAFEENFAHAFEHVIFAIVDWSNDDRFIGPFREVFEGR